MPESRQVRRGKLAREIAHKRRLLWVMKIAQDKLPLYLSERHASRIREMGEELQKMEDEFHELNVQQIRDEMNGAQSDS